MAATPPHSSGAGQSGQREPQRAAPHASPQPPQQQAPGAQPQPHQPQPDVEEEAELVALATRRASRSEPDIPSEYVPADEDELVTVTHGYGRVPLGWRNFIDRTLFVSGIARNVPYRLVKQWRLKAPGTILYTFRHDANYADFARVCGLSPDLLDPIKQGALLSAMQPREIIDAVGRQQALKIAEGLLKAIGELPGPGDLQRQAQLGGGVRGGGGGR